MPRLEDLSEIERAAALNFPFMEHDDSPNHPLSKPLSECKIALVTTAGLHVRGDRPFFHGDQTYRIIPEKTHPKDILQSHVSIGFDRVPVYKDINVSYPIDRLRELAATGKVASLSSIYISFMGAQRNPRHIIEEAAPEVSTLLKNEGVDLVLITPT